MEREVEEKVNRIRWEVVEKQMQHKQTRISRETERYLTQESTDEQMDERTVATVPLLPSRV